MREKILVVDDDPDLLDLVREILKDEGFAIDSAASGLDALKKIRGSRPALIVVDATMPQMDGFTFCESVRKNRATAAIPIIMLTGLPGQFGRLNGLAAGANVYLTKPFVPEELVAKINELLGEPQMR